MVVDDNPDQVQDSPDSTEFEDPFTHTTKNVASDANNNRSNNQSDNQSNIQSDHEEKEEDMENPNTELRSPFKKNPEESSNK